MINYTAIQNILETQLLTNAGLPTYTGENVKATPESTKPWCRASLLPAAPIIIGVGLGGQRQDQGFYQIDLFYPQNTGAVDANTMADQIQASYVRGQYYTDVASGVKILIDAAYRLPAAGLPGTTFYQLSVMIKWNYYTDH